MADPVTASVLAYALAKALGTAGGKTLARRLADLVGLMDAQTKMLGDIGRDVKALVEGPQETARSLIRDAELARADDKREELLRKARDALYQAASQETDPLRASYASSLLAVLYDVLDAQESEIITRHLRDAFESATKAAKTMEDRRVAAPRALKYLVGPLRFAAWAAVGPVRVSRRPKSVRVIFRSTAKAPFYGVAEVEQYSATRAAVKREHQLTEVHGYASKLRGLLIDRGQPEASLPEYRVSLVEAGSADFRTPRVHATFLALVYEPVGGGEPTSDRSLSDARRPVRVVRRRKGAVWEVGAKQEGTGDSGLQPHDAGG